jgi:hypothetical protein
MIFRYDFSKGVDFTAPRKQMLYYIPKLKDVTYHFLLKDYRIVTSFVENQDSTYTISLHINDIVRDEDGEIVRHNAIIPLSDMRFQNIHKISDMFVSGSHESYFTSNADDIESNVDLLIRIIKIVDRINNLKVFI